MAGADQEHLYQKRLSGKVNLVVNEDNQKFEKEVFEWQLQAKFQEL